MLVLVSLCEGFLLLSPGLARGMFRGIRLEGLRRLAIIKLTFRSLRQEILLPVVTLPLMAMTSRG